VEKVGKGRSDIEITKGMRFDHKGHHLMFCNGCEEPDDGVEQTVDSPQWEEDNSVTRHDRP
jgi:hypothetical protein